MFEELQEPMSIGQTAWYFRARRQRRSADVLVRMGWAECVERDAECCGYRLTDLGKLIAGPIVYDVTPEGDAIARRSPSPP